ncbi:hypothetical protein G9P44_001783 [Scheffersomyces stipitis]|nr:hypothetical protein G9P44_001783 [Scheffersomyces stipitis]
MRCEKSGLDCAGYDIKLGWSNPLTISDLDNSLIAMDIEDEKTDTFQRRNVELVQFPRSMKYQTYRELNRNLEILDNCPLELHKFKFRVGPFSVYKIDENGGIIAKQVRDVSQVVENSPLESTIGSIRNGSESSGSQLQFFYKGTPEPRTSNVRRQPSTAEEHTESYDEKSPPAQKTRNYDLNHELIFSKTNNSWVHFELLDYAKLTILAIKGAEHKFNEQNMLHILYPKFFANIESDDWLVDSDKVKKDLFVVDTTGQFTVKPHLQNLMKNFTSDIFSFNRIYYENNYFDTLVIPYLNNILFEFFCKDLASWSANNMHTEQYNEEDFTVEKLKQSIKLAIVYLVLSLSAFKMSRETSDNVVNDDDAYYVDNYLKLSIDVRKMATSIINFHLDEYDSHSERLEQVEKEKQSLEYENLLLLAFLLQIEVDNFFSVYENLELIFAIGDYIIKNKFKKTKFSNFSKLLVNVFKIKYIFFESTQSVNLFNYSISEGDEKMNYRDLNDNYNLGSDDEEEEADNNEDDDDDDDDDNDDHEKKGIQILPTVSNPILAESSKDPPNDYTPMSFTISFNKRRLTGYEEADDDGGGINNVTSSKGHTQEVYSPHPNWTSIVDSNTIHLMYGLPKSLLDLFHETIHLTNHKNIFRKRRVFPRNFPKICADIEDRIMNWNVSQSWKLDIENNSLHKCLHLNVEAMHNALLVYYCRLIKETTPANTITCREYATKALDYLQQLIQFNNKNEDASFRIRPSFWVLLVCGSEIHDSAIQRKLEEIWQLSQQYKLQYNNYWRGKQILYETWKRGNVGDYIGFMDMVREWDVVLCLG